MMIVDLVDERDFNEKLAQLGVPVRPDTELAETTILVEQWLADNMESKPALLALYESLLVETTTLLPGVKDTLAHHLNMLSQF